MKTMKLIIDNNLSDINEEIRWYLSSQIIWIGKAKDYKEVEELKKLHMEVLIGYGLMRILFYLIKMI